MIFYSFCSLCVLKLSLVSQTIINTLIRLRGMHNLSLTTLTTTALLFAINCDEQQHVSLYTTDLVKFWVFSGVVSLKPQLQLLD